MKSEEIILKGVKTHNLQDIDVSIPLHRLTCVTGNSGSGKSSLVFDTLYAESYRRYLDCLSSFTRRHIKSIHKPAITSSTPLPAAIALKQAKPNTSPRSNVGTITELSQLLVTLFSHFSQTFCCNQPIRDFLPEDTKELAEFLNKEVSAAYLLLSPLHYYKKMSPKELSKQLLIQGFSRIYENQKIIRLDDKPLQDPEDAYVVIQRMKAGKINPDQLNDDIQIALSLGHGIFFLQRIDKDPIPPPVRYSNNFSCNTCGKQYAKPDISLFSRSNAKGACSLCEGFTLMSIIDENKVIPDSHTSIADRGIKYFNFGNGNIWKSVEKSAMAIGIPLEKKFSEYSKSEKKWLWQGSKEKGSKFIGIDGFTDWLRSKRYKMHYRIFLARYTSYVPCSLCNATGYNDAALTPRMNFSSQKTLNIAEFESLSMSELGQWISWFQSSLNAPSKNLNSIKEFASRINFLIHSDLGYLNLARRTQSISGGEYQRLKLCNLLGSNLSQTLICLDEPSLGLHPKNISTLIQSIQSIKDRQNTVVCVEHNRQIIEKADYFIDIGPESGSRGGHVEYAGEDFKYFDKKYAIKPVRLKPKKQIFFGVESASLNNLKKIRPRFLLGGINTVTGVSGCGKSTLVADVLFPSIVNAVFGHGGSQGRGNRKTEIRPTFGCQDFTQVILLSQNQFSRSSRSNIATFLGIFDVVRDLFASTPEAKAKGLSRSNFSFNSKEGMCLSCAGHGYIIEDLGYLGEIKMQCQICQGSRYAPSSLEIRFLGYTIAEVLAFSVQQLAGLLPENKKIMSKIAMISSIGLDYLSLGQTTDTLSQGELQRLKLLKWLQESEDTGHSLMIVDEPTSGLSSLDVKKLVQIFEKIVQKGHTIVTIEHNSAIIGHSDWIVELGPGAADEGGTLLCEGPLAQVLKSPQSQIKKFYRFKQP